MHKTLMVRHMRRMHKEFTDWMQQAHPKTLRRAAMELAAYIAENREFMDAQFLGVMLKTLEFAIQQVGGTNWSVSKSKNDMRGRKHTRRRVPIDPKVRQQLHDRTKSFFEDMDQ